MWVKIGTDKCHLSHLQVHCPLSTALATWWREERRCRWELSWTFPAGPILTVVVDLTVPSFLSETRKAADRPKFQADKRWIENTGLLLPERCPSLAFLRLLHLGYSLPSSLQSPLWLLFFCPSLCIRVP